MVVGQSIRFVGQVNVLALGLTRVSVILHAPLTDTDIDFFAGTHTQMHTHKHTLRHVGSVCL